MRFLQNTFFYFRMYLFQCFRMLFLSSFEWSIFLNLDSCLNILFQTFLLLNLHEKERTTVLSHVSLSMKYSDLRNKKPHQIQSGWLKFRNNEGLQDIAEADVC